MRRSARGGGPVPTPLAQDDRAVRSRSLWRAPRGGSSASYFAHMNASTPLVDWANIGGRVDKTKGHTCGRRAGAGFEREEGRKKTTTVGV